MVNFIKILNAFLILFALFMGIKQGWGMISGKPEMLEMFRKLNMGKAGTFILGLITTLGAVLILFPKTFLYGNFIMAASILYNMALELGQKDLKSVLIEFPFFLLSLLIIYLQHPLVNSSVDQIK